MSNKLRSSLVDLVNGSKLTVWATPEVAKELDDAAEIADAQLTKGRRLERRPNSIRRVRGYMRLLAEQGAGQNRLDEKKFVAEGKHPSGRTDIPPLAVYAFKHDQCRVYGGFVDGLGFLCTVLAEPKKQDQADINELRRAAKRLAPYC